MSGAASAAPQHGIEHHYDQDTGTMQFIVWCVATKAAAIVDSVLDFDIKAAKTSTTNADLLLRRVSELGLNVVLILETHCHADHLTASQYLKEKLTKADGSSPPVAIGKHIVEVIRHWVPIFDNADDTPLDGRQFDKLWEDDEEFNIGQLHVKVMYTPGHTPACVTYYFAQQGFALCGDTVFNPALGNARCDFPGGSAATLLASARRLLALPPQTVLFVGHDYPEGGSTAVPGVTVAEHRANNCTLNERVTEQEFVAANSDKLPVPRLLLPSLQVNLRAGHLSRFIKLPLNLL